MLRVRLNLGSHQLMSLSGSLVKGDRYRQGDPASNTEHVDLTKEVEAEEKLRRAREKQYERIDGETLATLNTPPKPKDEEKPEGEEEEAPEEAAAEEGGDEGAEEGDEEFE